MGITSAIVLFAVVWFMTLFVVLPLRLVTQDEAGEVVPGTHKGAPADVQIGRKAKLTTYWAIPIWAVICAVIFSGTITVRDDLDWFGRMSPPSEAAD